MAYNHGREERRWRIWKAAEEKLMRECGTDESILEQLYIYDRAEFNSDRRFYRRLQEVGIYLDEVAQSEQALEISTVETLLGDIDNDELFKALQTVDKRTLQIVLMKMQGYSTKEIAQVVHLTPGAVYARLHHLRKKLSKIL